MADYNQRLYPNHNNMWKKIHLLNSENLNRQTLKTLDRFESTLSKALKRFSKSDIESLLNTDHGPRPHPNTFILKKLGISPKTYKTIRYAIFNHTRHADGNNPDNLVPSVNKYNPYIDNIGNSQNEEIKSVLEYEPKSSSEESSQDCEVQIKQLQSQIDGIKSAIKNMSDNLTEYLISYITDFENDQKEKLRDDLRAEIKQIRQQISKKYAQIQSANAGEAFLGGLLGGGAVLAIEEIIKKLTSNPIEDLENRINEISQNIYQMNQSLQIQQRNIEILFEWVKSIANITDGFNYLRLFRVPITQEDWDRLSDDVKQSWSPFHIKPPLTDEKRKAIAEFIKRNEPPTVEMCYDLG
ncbi:FlxA-like family protein [Athalassotoga saccharophila]|nr:FlxA-like family protein [Athalassotoga saccharophila]